LPRRSETLLSHSHPPLQPLLEIKSVMLIFAAALFALEMTSSTSTLFFKRLLIVFSSNVHNIHTHASGWQQQPSVCVSASRPASASSSAAAVSSMGSGVDFARLHVQPLEGVAFVDGWKGGSDAGARSCQRHFAPELFASYVIVKVLLTHGPIVVVGVQTLHRSIALNRARVFFDGNFATRHF